MKFLKENLNFIIFGIILILLVVIIFLYFFKEKEIIKTFNNDGVQMIKIYTNKNADKIFSKIEKETDSNKISTMLRNEGVDKFIINNNGAITAGKHYDGDKYLVSLVKKDKVVDIVRLENESLFVSEKDDILVAVIHKDLSKAKTISNKCLDDKQVDESYAVYLIDGSNKKMTKKFENHLK